MRWVSPRSPRRRRQRAAQTPLTSIEQASKDIISALIAGDDARVASLAQQIHDSFILQQSMTPQDKQDLKAAVPKEFVTRDQAFHQLSTDLAQVGRDGDREAQNATFSQMIGACTACHTRYATDRFPMLAK
ncbi:cytochrome c [Thioclava sp. IC9]|uniref:cytochrome c n=2 Tax=unclassified Thioclava TaxID=2621713 RepID=UPI00141299AA|nr:cytochrome c [Thioclava sp. IC9]